ncbi:uncharacterized protein LOC129741523 [Uranotaenia lowii]|uniref:uncharacterized protein LOC129741523 n=1 Tax=Uranotaenia lowii TaxID=190385 RepID=UPI00247B1C0F|nr:uncharacterized protein LOC129741523 [Uranotaenia lowii]XP_055589239.1 uncharacterized protein LOC129741523 [Uranotaenia lowii]
MTGSIECLPFELLEKIFTYLPLRDVREAGQVCHLWNSVLHAPRFERQLRITLQQDFREPMSDADRNFVAKCRNLTIFQQFHDNSSTSDNEDEETVEAASNEAEKNIANIIFSANDLECLQLTSRFSNLRCIINSRLMELQKLKELRISFCDQPRSGVENTEDAVWLLQNDSLESFKIGLAYSISPFDLVAPNLIELHLTINCDILLKLVEKFSHQLKHLKTKLTTIEDLDQIMSFNYPRLKHLELAMYDDKDMHYEYARSANRTEDDTRAKKFLKQVPGLQSLSLLSHVALYKICPSLCSVETTKLEELEFHNMEVDANILLNVLLVQPVKNLVLQHCEIINDLPGLHIRMVGLQRLKLINIINNVLLEHNFCSLKELELAHGFKYGNDILLRIFQNFSSVEHLTLQYRAQLDECAFQRLHQLRYLKSLTIRATEITYELWQCCNPLVSVEQLTIIGCFMLPFSMFRGLGRIFPSLKRLNVDNCHIVEDTSGTDGSVDGACERKLRAMYPDIVISWHQSEQITPMLLKHMLL